MPQPKSSSYTLTSFRTCQLYVHRCLQLVWYICTTKQCDRTVFIIMMSTVSLRGHTQCYFRSDKIKLSWHCIYRCCTTHTHPHTLKIGARDLFHFFFLYFPFLNFISFFFLFVPTHSLYKYIYNANIDAINRYSIKHSQCNMFFSPSGWMLSLNTNRYNVL